MTPEEAQAWRPSRPNLLVTGTPGTGKSTVCSAVAQQLGLRHVDVGAFARERNLVESYDDELNSAVLHEEAVLDALEPIMATGAVALDYHSCDWFPERWIQAVVILRADTTSLYDRLEGRGYGRKKMENNMQAEIMQIVAEEARESYPKAVCLEMMNGATENLDDIVKKVAAHYNKMLEPFTEEDVVL